MNAKLVDGPTKDYVKSMVVNEDATYAATIPVGTPVILSMNGTDDGTAVIMPSTAGAAQTQALFYGITLFPLPYGQGQNGGYVMRSGLAQYGLVNVALTRSATTAVWPSMASIAAWQVLAVDTVNNCFSIASVSVGTGPRAFAVLAGTINSQAAATVTASTDTRTISIAKAKVWINLM